MRKLSRWILPVACGLAFAGIVVGASAQRTNVGRRIDASGRVPEVVVAAQGPNQVVPPVVVRPAGRVAWVGHSHNQI